MVIVRMSRGGARHRPFYHFVVADSRYPRDGRFIERLGYYNPMASGQDIPFVCDQERLKYWQSKGAQVSPTVSRIVKKFNKIARNS